MPVDEVSLSADAFLSSPQSSAVAFCHLFRRRGSFGTGRCGWAMLAVSVLVWKVECVCFQPEELKISVLMLVACNARACASNTNEAPAASINH